MLESIQNRQGTSSDVFRTVVSPETTNILLEAAVQTETKIVLVEIPTHRTKFIDGKLEPEAETKQKEVMVEIIWETKRQEQDFWVAFDTEWRNANC